MKTKFLSFFLLLCFGWQQAPAAGVDATTRREIGRTLSRIVAREVSGGFVRIEGVDASRKRVRIYTSVGLSITRSRAEPAGHVRLGACRPAAGVPQGLETIFQQARSAGADPDGLPHRCRVQETAAQEEGRALRQPFAAAARRPPVLARSSRRALRAPYRAVAEPRTLFRPACEPLEMAAFAAVDDLRRPLYPELAKAPTRCRCSKMREPA